MPDRSNPVALSVLGNLSLGKDEAAEKSRISGMVEQGLSWDRERGGWVDRQRLLTRLRYGLRREKTFPWKTASNPATPLHCPCHTQVQAHSPAAGGGAGSGGGIRGRGRGGR